MTNQDIFFSRWTPRILSVLRIIAAFLFMAHGSQKLFNYPPPLGQNNMQLELLSMRGIGGILEFFGGLLLLVGLFTRPVAFLLSGMMAVAYFLYHAPQGFLPLVNRGELAALYCFLFFFIFFAGGGEWSVDSWWRGREDYKAK
jgi:putative oxidoreductase